MLALQTFSYKKFPVKKMQSDTILEHSGTTYSQNQLAMKLVQSNNFSSIKFLQRNFGIW